MNVSRGLFRVWVIYATIAYVTGGLFVWDCYAHQYSPDADALIEYFTVPIAVLLVGWALFKVGLFIRNGFRPAGRANTKIAETGSE